MEKVKEWDTGEYINCMSNAQEEYRKYLIHRNSIFWEEWPIELNLYDFEKYIEMLK